MKSILIKKKMDIYCCKKLDNSDYKLEILADWFIDDVRNINAWRNWLNDCGEDAETTDSNATWLEKDWSAQGTCEIIFGSISHMIKNTKNGVYTPEENEIVRIPKNNVVELLNSWEQLLKTRSEEIMIIEKSGIYSMFEV